MEEPKDKEKDSTGGSSKKKGFFEFVFNFDEESKASILNLVQFALLSFIPIVLLNKSMQKYVPEADEQKSSIELLIEILAQIIVMFLGIFFIHRILIFIPTFSEVKYPDFNIIITVIPILLISLSLQTKLGEKVSILTDRISDSWDGNSKKKKKASNNNSVTITQPLSNTSQPMVQNFVGGTTSISSLPSNGSGGGGGGGQPNFDSFYPSGGRGGEPQDEQPQILAANEVLGGGGWSGF